MKDTISKEQVIKFLNSTYKELGIPRKLCEKCDSPSSKNHQGIWCDYCPGKMIDRSDWTVLACTERLENSLKNSKRLNKFSLKNLLLCVGIYVYGPANNRTGVEGVNWAWNKENEKWVIDIYREQLSKN